MKSATTRTICRNLTATSITFILCSFLACALDAKEKRPARTSVYSEASKDYKRELLSNGQFKTETYAFAEGSLLDHGTDDDSLTALSFRDFGEILANALYEEQYIPTPSPEKTDLLLMVHWGRTVPGSDALADVAMDGMSEAVTGILDISSQIGPEQVMSPEQASQMDDLSGVLSNYMLMQEMSDRERREANEYNANLLGYSKQMNKLDSLHSINPHFGGEVTELLYEIENPRYFVIIQAFDFQMFWKQKLKKLLWVSKFSIRTKGRRFDEEILNMARAASRSFGQDNGGLKRFQTPGKVIIGELEFLGVEDKE